MEDQGSNVHSSQSGSVAYFPLCLKLDLELVGLIETYQLVAVMKCLHYPHLGTFLGYLQSSCSSFQWHSHCRTTGKRKDMGSLKDDFSGSDEVSSLSSLGYLPSFGYLQSSWHSHRRTSGMHVSTKRQMAVWLTHLEHQVNVNSYHFSVNHTLSFLQSLPGAPVIREGRYS